MGTLESLGHLLLTRRQFLTRSGWGLGGIALASLRADDAPAPTNKPHFPARAKGVIYLGQIGAPSQLDLFDHKPTLEKMDGKPVPDSIVKGQSFVFIGQGKTQIL